jgi:hypothetical protein
MPKTLNDGARSRCQSGCRKTLRKQIGITIGLHWFQRLVDPGTFITSVLSNGYRDRLNRLAVQAGTPTAGTTGAHAADKKSNRTTREAVMRRLLFTCCIALGFSFVAVPKASADTITFNLNDIYCNCLSAGDSNGGTVTLTTNANGSITFDVSLSNALLYHDTNAFALFAFNYTNAGGALTLDSISQSGWTLVLGTDQNPTGVKMDGAGQAYTYGIVCNSCANFTGVNEFTFTVSGTSTLTLAMFETKGTNNNDFAAAVYNATTTACTGVIGGGDGANQSTAQASSGTGSTGTDTCSSTSVPDGGTTVGLLGLGLLGLGYFRRRLA